MSSPAFLTTKAVAEMYDVNPATVRVWIRTGRLPAVRTPGGRLRIRAEDVARMLTEPQAD